MSKGKILPQSYYLSEEVLTLSQDLLGKILVTKFDNKLTSGRIVETEAYYGVQDKASHAYNHRRTPRTQTMYLKGGVAYVYLCYGMHHLFNIVTAKVDVPHAILIRAIEPLMGINTMLVRRRMATVKPNLTAGPGALSAALGITKNHDGTSLTKGPIWIEEDGFITKQHEILASPRVGINYAEEYRDLPWRFRLKSSRWTSKAK
jgi:DNA-3-methyladenine glycosylase